MLPRSLRLALILAPLGCGGPDDSLTGATSVSTTAGTSTGSDVTGTTNPTTASTGAPTTGPDPTSTTSVGTTDDTTGTTAPTTATTGSSGPATTGTDTGTTAPAESCDDGAQNQDETDVDCGGSCSPCADGQACVVPGDCQSATCEGGMCVPAGCQSDDVCAPMSDACNKATCDLMTMKCVLTPVGLGTPCDDGDLCTKVDVCEGGMCSGKAPLDCANLDSFCGLGVCDPQTGMCGVKSKDGMDGVPCDDGFACTPEDTCEAGKCGTGDPGYVLFEDFSGNAPGWTLGSTWQIGAAKPSKKGSTGSDPMSDHTLTNDDRLAGAIIGGLVEGPAQPYTCLTSPAVDVTVGKSVWVTFWRHLHTDYFPFALNRIEAFDGVDWIEIEAGYNNPGVDDPNWQQIYFDVSDYAHEAFQFRICYSRSVDADPFAGWSVDDVTIGPYACTP